MTIPRHIAIIMDGNGRWAKARNLPKIIGHKEGVEAVKRVVKACLDMKVRYLTLYAFSTENWMRPPKEVMALFQLLEDFIDKEFELFHKNKVRVCIIGERQRIEKRLLKKIENLEKDTINYTDLIVNIALSYGARQEIVNAARVLSEEVKKGRLEPLDINEDMLTERLYTRGQPDPDLLIRTSGEMRISNFLLWQISYAEFYVTEKFWPDFGEEDLRKAIEEYSKRERRFGR
jgi:undecaprenyl diphosphate synthase